MGWVITIVWFLYDDFERKRAGSSHEISVIGRLESSPAVIMRGEKDWWMKLVVLGAGGYKQILMVFFLIPLCT